VAAADVAGARDGLGTHALVGAHDHATPAAVLGILRHPRRGHQPAPLSAPPHRRPLDARAHHLSACVRVCVCPCAFAACASACTTIVRLRVWCMRRTCVVPRQRRRHGCGGGHAAPLAAAARHDVQELAVLRTPIHTHTQIGTGKGAHTCTYTGHTQTHARMGLDWARCGDYSCVGGR
jgi:hypothetical protein